MGNKIKTYKIKEPFSKPKIVKMKEEEMNEIKKKIDNSLFPIIVDITEIIGSGKLTKRGLRAITRRKRANDKIKQNRNNKRMSKVDVDE